MPFTIIGAVFASKRSFAPSTVADMSPVSVSAPVPAFRTVPTFAALSISARSVLSPVPIYSRKQSLKNEICETPEPIDESATAHPTVPIFATDSVVEAVLILRSVCAPVK